MAQGRGGVDRRIVRLNGKSLTKQPQCLVCLAWHVYAKVRNRTQIEIISVETVGPLALGVLDLGVLQIRLDCADDCARQTAACGSPRS